MQDHKRSILKQILSGKGTADQLREAAGLLAFRGARTAMLQGNTWTVYGGPEGIAEGLTQQQMEAAVKGYSTFTVV